MKQADFLKRRVTAEDMLEIQQSINETPKDDTPFMVVSKQGEFVTGDPNKIDIKSHDYAVRFRFPKSMAEGIDPKDIIQTIGDYVIVRFEFSDVHIKPKNDVDIIAAIVRILPYFKTMNKDDFTVKDKTPEELIALVKTVNDDIGVDLYDVVAAVLDVDKSIKDYMILTDVLAIIKMLPEDFPEAFNEADSFFG